MTDPMIAIRDILARPTRHPRIPLNAPGWYWDKDGHPWEVEASGDTLEKRWGPYTRIRTEAEIAAEVLRAVKADVHPGHMGTGSYSHIMACLTHVAERYGVEL